MHEEKKVTATKFMPKAWPIPAINEFNRPFFTSGIIVLQECSVCGCIQHPPEEFCHQCFGVEFISRATSGQGTIYSYTVVHHPVALVLTEVVPYAIALVALDEYPAVRLLGNVLNCSPDNIRIGQRVKAVFEEIHDEELNLRILLPQWHVI